MTGCTEVHDRYVTLDGLRFHYREWGDPAAPALVLLHGGWEQASTWDPVAAALAERYRVLALDQRGHGESDRAEDYAVSRMADDIEAFADALRLGCHALCGYSMGGVVALMYAGQRPEAVTRLAMIDHGPDVAERLRPRLEASGKTYAPPPPTDPALTLPEPVLSTLPPAAAQWAAVRRIACPTLLVHAERSDRFGRETAEQMAAAIGD